MCSRVPLGKRFFTSDDDDLLSDIYTGAYNIQLKEIYCLFGDVFGLPAVIPSATALQGNNAWHLFFQAKL